MEKLIVSSSPHFNGGRTTQNIMLDVIIALVPAMVASVILFGFRAAVVILTCVATCVLSEYLCRRVMKRPQTVGDLSCVVTGILLALNLPVTINPLIAVFGGVVAIVVVKQMFGGIGQNFVNPALTARIILMTSFPTRMTTWTAPFAYMNGEADAPGALRTGRHGFAAGPARNVPGRARRLPGRNVRARAAARRHLSCGAPRDFPRDPRVLPGHGSRVFAAARAQRSV